MKIRLSWIWQFIFGIEFYGWLLYYAALIFTAVIGSAHLIGADAVEFAFLLCAALGIAFFLGVCRMRTTYYPRYAYIEPGRIHYPYKHYIVSDIPMDEELRSGIVDLRQLSGENITFRQGILGRRYNIGSIRIRGQDAETHRRGRYVLSGVMDFEEVKKYIYTNFNTPLQ